MKQIIQPAETNFSVRCDKCGCVFTYELEDVISKTNTLFPWDSTTIEHQIITCPHCLSELLHKVTNKMYQNNEGTLEDVRVALLQNTHLEKQVPKKPNIEGDGYDDKGELIYDTWYCPNCEASYEIDYDDYDYCPKCGQAIDKSEMQN